MMTLQPAGGQVSVQRGAVSVAGVRCRCISESGKLISNHKEDLLEIVLPNKSRRTEKKGTEHKLLT